MYIIKCDSRKTAEAVGARLAHYEANFYFVGELGKELETDMANAKAMADQFGSYVSIYKGVKA